MSKNPRFARATIDVEVNAVTSLLNGGYLRIYSGRQPDPDAPPKGHVLLAELRWASPAFAPADNGVAVAEPIPAVLAVGEGRASWFRTSTVAGATVFDGSVGESEDDYDLAIDIIDLKPGAQFTLRRFQYG